MASEINSSAYSEGDIAIVGMAAHLPGASDIDTYWRNLEGGVESIRRLSQKDLTQAGEATHVIQDPNYVPAAAVLDDFEKFDGEFFGLSPKESAIMDPQHRQFLECSWEALENAGHPPESIPGPVGVYAGCGMGSYFYFNICSNPDLVDETGMFLLRHTGNDKDFLTTRLSHILDLKGPSVSIQTACSTSLVATHYACQALQNAECDMALAGGVTIELPHGRGYVYQEGEILSPDGHCHAFDHRAEGTVFGSGVGVVVLRRIEDAIRDGDHIWAVIKGTAINNDGAAKAGYLAPSVDGQAAAISEAHAMAGVEADTIDYVECHGTGTYLGDPIEVSALTEAFRETTNDTGFCRIGSVKTNIGHLDTAAGVASLIKVALSLHNKKMPPSLGYEKPNPAIDFENSPFRVNDKLSLWNSAKGPRRAGVNSLGVGGTNAHAIIDEAPERPPSDEADWPFQLLTISAKSKAALDDASLNLAEALTENTDVPLADIAWTLKEGRRAFEKRRVVVAETHEEAARYLKENNTRRVFTHSVVANTPKAVFMFPGGGAQYANMARDLYETEPVFQDWMDRGLDILQQKADFDVRAVWLPETGEEDAANETLRKPSVQLPLIMITEYALAQLWMSWGIQPEALIGHSMGENTAACVAGVISFEDCIALVHLRGKLFDTVPAGGMLSVPISADELKSYLGDNLDLAAENGPHLSVASGPRHELDALKETLEKSGVECQDIPIDIAAHSKMLEPILGEFRQFLENLHFQEPSIPFISNRSGDWISNADAMDPEYWVAHLRNTVHFASGIETLSEDSERVYIEVGPGKALSSLTQSHPSVSPNQVISTLRHEMDEVGDDAYFLAMLGRCWATGLEIDWQQFWGEQKRHRVPLPTYPFQRSPYFIEPGEQDTQSAIEPPSRISKTADWGFKQNWRPKTADIPFDIDVDLASVQKEVWLLFLDDVGLGDEVCSKLRASGQKVITVSHGDSFARDGEESYILSTERGREGYVNLMASLMSRGLSPTRIGHFWLTTTEESFRPGSSFFHRNIEQGFFSITFLLQAIEEVSLPKPTHITLVSSDAMQVHGEKLRYPEKAMVAGPLRVASREITEITCSQIDLPLLSEAPNSDDGFEGFVTPVLEELFAAPNNSISAYRKGRRYEPWWARENLGGTDADRLKGAKTFFITGGFGGIGVSLARHFAQSKQANFVLLSRDELPNKDQWDNYLETVAPTDKTAQRIEAIREIEALGGKVLTCAADITNLEEMQTAVAAANKAFGRVDVVIHSAGILDDGPLVGRRMVETEAVLAPKLHGTQVLEHVFPDGSIDELVLFSSTSTITAPAGQADYIAANEYLNAYAKSRSDGKTRVTSINWGIWADVGMAANLASPRRFDPQSVPVTGANSPLFETAHFDKVGNRAFFKEFSESKDWVFDEHRTLDGKALMPGTGFVEVAAQAMREQREDYNYDIQNLFFLSPFHIPGGQTRTMRAVAKRIEKGYQLRVQSTEEMSDIPDWMTHCEAEIAISQIGQPDPIDLGKIAERLGASLESPSNLFKDSPQEHLLGFGPRWKTLLNETVGQGEGLAELRMNPRAEGGEGYVLHPALLDIATGWAIRLVPEYKGEHLWVPMSYQSVRVHAPLTDRIFSWARLSPRQTAFDTIASVDVTICDEHGNVLVDVFGFQMQKQENTDFLNSDTLLKAQTEKDKPADATGTAASNSRFQQQLSQGIPSADGVKLFERALETGQSQIVVSSMDINELAANTTAESAKLLRSTTHSFQRPKLESEFAEPSTEVERTLAEFWEDLLGVQNVGVDDSFFDLGGHSLIAVRLFSQIRKSFGVNFPISVLFEAPTIRACAKLIEDQIGSKSVASDAGGDQEEHRFKHIVAMHDGEGGPRNPFFLVAGMFGNVLNLRHLAHLLGEDRPFYGLQARGLLGNDSPHQTIEEAAKDYIAEMRSVQPEGPYYIGGFSGGGIFALEVAQQLKKLGEHTQLLVLLDTPLPQRRPLTKIDRAYLQIGNLKEQGWRYPIEWLKGRLAWKAKQQDKEAALEADKSEHQFHSAEIEAAFLRATEIYKAEQWRGTTVLYRPPQIGKWTVSKGNIVSHERHYLFSDNDWGDRLPNLTVTEVPGDHDSMVLEPNVRVLATRLRADLEKAERAALIDGPSNYARAAE